MTAGRQRIAGHPDRCDRRCFINTFVTTGVSVGPVLHLPHERESVADLGGGPIGAAFGSDGTVCVSNPGEEKWQAIESLLYPFGPALDNAGGSIQRVNIETGGADVPYSQIDGYRLGAPNDIDITRSGGLWFTDTGNSHERCHNCGGIYYARNDGSLIRQAAFPIKSPGRIGLSPAVKHLI